MKIMKAALLTLAILCSFAGAGKADVVSDASGKPEAAAEAKAKVIAEPKKGTERSMAVDASVKIEAPPSKGGPKTRGAWCRVHIDNRTQWPVDVWLNNTWVGVVAPFGDSYADEPGQLTSCYGQVKFTDGTWKSWDFNSVNLDDYGSYTFRIWP